MNLYKQFVKPFLFSFNPERAHHITFLSLRVFKPFLGLLFPTSRNDNTTIELFGLEFKHPIGLAAGLDKNGEAFTSLSKLGFSFLELGTVTPKPQPGNPKPRSFRLPQDKALINRMGFNNLGVDQLVERLRNRPTGLIIGGNIGKNTNTPNEKAKDDYLYCFQKLYGHVDYFVVNVSCPNIKDLKDLQDKDKLLQILRTVMQDRETRKVKVPILLKVSPDLNYNQLDDLIEVVKETRIDGLIATNTSVTRENLSTSKERIDQIANGGLSGAPIHAKSCEIIRYLRSKMPAEYPIIASGGIMSAKDAKQSLEAGAQLLQLYTGFIYEGPQLIKRIIKAIK